MRLIDLTQPLTTDSTPYPGHPAFRRQILQNWPRQRLNTFLVETSMHTGTHVDAPFHMAPGGWTVGEIPLERLYGSAVIVDLSDQVEDWTVITPEMLEAAAPDKIGEGDIVILYYGWKRFSSVGESPDMERYFCKHPGPTRRLVDWLLERKIRWVGSDAPSFEHPFNIFLKQGRPDLVEAYERSTKTSVQDLFPDEDWMCAHLEMGKRNIMHVDQMGGDLPAVAGRRIDVGVFPWRWAGGDASIARVVAFDSSE